MDKKKKLQKYLPYLVAFALFVIISCVYCIPSLEGRVVRRATISAAVQPFRRPFSTIRRQETAHGGPALCLQVCQTIRLVEDVICQLP